MSQALRILRNTSACDKLRMFEPENEIMDKIASAPLRNKICSD
jgi:hypothetical protein